jgi:hypothetical protein
MKKILLILIILNFKLSSQDFGLIFVNLDSAYATKTIKQSIEVGHKKKSISSCFQKQSGDTLITTVQDSINGFILKITFNQPDTVLKEKLCDFQQYTFDCTPCSKKFIEFYKKSSGFRKLSENKYLSNYWNRTEMEINHKSQNSGCLVVTFRTVYMTKEKYKTLYKSLSKN